MQTIQLAQGSGGIATNELIERVFLKHLGEMFVNQGEDAGVFCPNGEMALSTDSFIITPLTFAGGDIGKLSVCGSSNDVAMMGAKPEFISFGFMIEEGLSIDTLENIIKSIALELKKTDIKILSADTKVLPKGGVDKIFINTTALGSIKLQNISAKNLQINDKIILSAPIGAHGASIFASREEIGLSGNLQSDCAQLYPMLEPLFERGLQVHAMRDATRGGLSAVLNEWANASNVMIDINEERIPIDDEVKGVCEILGLEAYMLANEGVCVLSVDTKCANEVCEILCAHPLGKKTQIIGEVIAYSDSKMLNNRVVLNSQWGGKRFMEYPQGELLPRIC